MAMRHPELKTRTLSTLLILALLAPSKARADLSEQMAFSNPQITLSFEVPFGGDLDRFHNPLTTRNPVANTLYAYRNAAVEDLLNTRKALKLLIGGEAGLRPIDGAAGLTFSAPSSVTRLYLSGDIRLHRDIDPTLGAWSAEYDQLPPRSSEAQYTDEFAASIQWLGSSSPANRVNTVDVHRRLALGLAQASALLTKYDQQIRFIENDWWAHRPINSEFYQTEMAEMDRAMAQGGSDEGAEVHYERLKGAFLHRHGMDEPLALLHGHREFLIQRYHLLVIDVDGQPLYKKIYADMERSGFPNHETAQRPLMDHLPPGTEPIPLPTEFEEQVTAQLTRLAENSSIAQALARKINPTIDRALVSSLRSNTERLNELCQDVHFMGSMSSTLLDLARHEEIRDAAREKYGYLAGPIDFHNGEEQILQYLAASDRTTQRLQYAGYAAGIGLGVAALVASQGTAGLFLGVGARSWLFGSMLFSTAMSGLNYVDARDVAHAANGMFFGGTLYGSAAAARESLLIAQDQYRMLIASLVLCGFELHQIQAVARLVPLFQRATQPFAALSRNQVTGLRSALSRVAAQVESLVPAGRALISYLQRSLDLVAGNPTLLNFEQAIPMVATELRLTAAQARARLLTIPRLGPLLQNAGGRVSAVPAIWVKVARDLTVNGIMNVIAQREARGDRFMDEFGNVALTFATSTITTGILSYLGNSINIRGRPSAEVSRRLHAISARNFWVGVGVHGISTSIAEALDEFHHPGIRTVDDRLQTVAARALFGGIFMATSGTLRSGISRRLEESLETRLRSTSVQLIMLPISAMNNGFGSWHFVKIASAIGVEAPAGSRTSSDLEEAEPELVDLGGAYARIDDDPATAAYMFDFVSGAR